MTQKTHLDQVIFTKTKKYGCFMTVFYLINDRFYLIYDRLVTDIVNINKSVSLLYIYISKNYIGIVTEWQIKSKKNPHSISSTRMIIFFSHRYHRWTQIFFEHESLEYRMFWAHGWTRIYRADGIIQWSGGKRFVLFERFVFKKINGPEEKICEIREIRVL